MIEAIIVLVVAVTFWMLGFTWKERERMIGLKGNWYWVMFWFGCAVLGAGIGLTIADYWITKWR